MLQGTLQALKVVLTSPMSRAEKSRGAWAHMLQCALNTLLDCWDTERSGCVVDEVSLLTALTIFLLSTSPEVTTLQPLHTRSLDKFKNSLETKDPLVLSRTYQLLTSVFQSQQGVSVPYIQALGPVMVRHLQRVERSRPQSPDELLGVLDGLRAMEALVLAADDTHRSKLVAILLPILISFLLDENALGSAPAASRSLHESALRDLMRLGPQHSSVFKALMTASPHMKARLEAAVKGNQESLNAKASSTTTTPSKTSPSITLKTNFL